jgi:hypothetical protein
MMKRSPIVLACLLGTAVLTVPACGPASGPAGSTGAPQAQQQTPSEGGEALAAHREFFQRELIDSGHDAETRVGEFLTVLGLDWQQLQAMPVEQAYTLTHDTVMRFPDERMRRQMLASLFNEKDSSTH